jgi:hypothetical protein
MKRSHPDDESRANSIKLSVSSTRRPIAESRHSAQPNNNITIQSLSKNLSITKSIYISSDKSFIAQKILMILLLNDRKMNSDCIILWNGSFQELQLEEMSLSAGKYINIVTLMKRYEVATQVVAGQNATNMKYSKFRKIRTTNTQLGSLD